MEKILLVGDNSSNVNWGGRGASFALINIFSSKFNIAEKIKGYEFHKKCYVNTLFPKRFQSIFMHLCANRNRRRIFDYYLRLEEFLGAKDFISHDPKETVENILRYKNSYKEIQVIYEKAENADILIIHGEGDVVFTTPPRREALYLLGMAELGLYLNKKVFFVNGMISDCPVTGRNLKTLQFARNTLSRCNAVIVRDYKSLEYVEGEMPEASSSFLPDSLFTWYPAIENSGAQIPDNGDFIIPYPEKQIYFGKLDFSKPYICIGGSALAAQNKEKSEHYFTQLVRAIRKLDYTIYLTENCGGDSFLENVASREGVGIIPVYTSVFMAGAILANARLFISGRYHPAILASLGGTPCIFLGSSAHKMYSLQELLEYEFIREFSVFPSGEELLEIVELAKGYLEQGNSLRRQIKATAKRRCDEASGLPELIYQMTRI